MQLNERQHAAVHYLDGPCLVLAGAGSGKTRVISNKIAYLLRDCGYQARNVFALTFTNKAAREMHERVREQIDARLLRGLTVGTFHSLGLRLLREEHAHAGLKAGFSILDATDALAIVQDLLATTDKALLRSVQQSISLWKNALLSPQEASAAARPEDATALSVYHSYQATLQAYQALDFDDLIRLPAQLLQTNPALRERWQNRVHYLLVDEYQDTNACQYQLLRLLSGQREQFTAVGDNDQAIYAWRGATSANLEQLARDYPKLKLIKLEQNYRSVQSILQAANNVIHHNPRTFDKILWTEHAAGEPIAISAMDSDLHEAESVAMRISAARFQRQAQWRDFAVLYRGNHQARVLEQALRNLRIPYTVSGGQSFFERAEIRDMLAWLRLLANPDDDPAFIRAATTPKRGIGQSSLQALGEFATRTGVSLSLAAASADASILPTARQRNAVGEFDAQIEKLRAQAASGRGACAELLDQMLVDIGYEPYLYDVLDERQAQQRWQNVLELFEWLKRKANEDGLGLLELVQHVVLVTMLDRAEDEEPDAVKLSTLHAAKGLEYPHVYLIGVEEGLLPHRGRDEDYAADDAAALVARLEEERRLMYVGITRAQRSLHISWCRKRRRAREDVFCEPSRFIQEMGLAQAPKASSSTDPDQALRRLKDLLKK